MVQLPWIEGDQLLRGTVIVPPDGHGARVLDRVETIAQGMEWQLPPRVSLMQDGPRALWLVGKAEAIP